MVKDHLKTVGSHLGIWAMLTSCSKHGRLKKLHYGIVQDSIETFLDSITKSFEPKRFAKYIASVKEQIDQVA